MNEIEDIIYVVPTPKGRARSRVVGKKVITYTPSQTRRQETMIREQMLKHIPFDPGVPLKLSATFYIPKPQSASKKQVYPVKRPDLDNYEKLLMDALNKYIWPDDAQIVDLHTRKRFGSPPRIEIIISEVLE